MVTVGDEHVEQGALQAGFRLEEDVVRKGPMKVWPKKKKKKICTLSTSCLMSGWYMKNPLTLFLVLLTTFTVTHPWQGAIAAKWNVALSHEWGLSAWRCARQPAETGNNLGCSPVASVHHWPPSRSWHGVRWARLCERTFSLWERFVGLHERTDGSQSRGMLRWWSVTCQVLLNVWALLQEPGPSHRPSVEHSYILVHHLFIGLIVLRSLKAIGVDPAGANHTVYTRLPCHRGDLLGHNAAAAEWLWTRGQKTHLNSKTLTFYSTDVDISVMKQ